MKNIKKIFAIVAVVFLIGLYAATIIFSLSDNPDAQYLFKAAIFCTVVIPALLYGIIVICKAFGYHQSSGDEDTDSDNSDT
jgi:magnesium-transporting ATPase (P-type)